MDKSSNGFKANPGKFHFLLGPFVDRPIKIMGSTIKASKEEALLLAGITSCINKGFQIHELTKASHSHEVVYRFTV